MLSNDVNNVDRVGPGRAVHLVIGSELHIEIITIEIQFFMANNVCLSFTIIHVDFPSVV